MVEERGEPSPSSFALLLAVCVPAPVTRLPGPVPGACFAGSHSPWSPPLAPPAPQRIAPPCSSASQLLWRSPTSHARASSATAPRLPDADRSAACAVGRSWGLPVPAQGASAHARVSDHAGSSEALALTRPVLLPSALRTASALGIVSFAAQWLAYALPYRRFAPVLADDGARLGANVDRYSFIVVDFHHLLLAGLPAHAKRYPSTPVAVDDGFRFALPILPQSAVPCP